MTVVDDWDGMGQRTTASGTVRLDAVSVPADRVLPHLDPAEAARLAASGFTVTPVPAAEAAAVHALTGKDGARELVRRYGKVLDAPCGSLTHLFPEPAVLAEAEPDGPLGALAAALADGTVRLDPGADRYDAQQALLALPGMDPATVAAVRVRALGDPDVAPPGAQVPDDWRPWRTYAVRHLRAAGEWNDR